MLELKEEELESLEEGIFVEGSAVVKLMRHYNQSENVSVSEIASTPQMLDTIMDEAHGNNDHYTFLIPLHVHSISKRYDAAAGQNHFVGLVVRRVPGELEGSPPRYVATYIDPMGHAPSPEILEQTRIKLGATAEINHYTGRLQFAELRDGADGRATAGAQYYEGNDKDCGPMLVYLMTRAAQQRELPTVYARRLSMATGVILRRTFSEDNGKEAAASRDIASDDFREELFARATDIFRDMGRDLGVAAAGAGFELSDERMSRNPAAGYRRLDSIARLITGNSVCSAVAFDGRDLLYANNNSEETELSSSVFRLLGEVARSRTPMSEMNARFGKEMERIVDETTSKYFSKKRRKPSPKAFMDYRNRMISDINKVVCSLAVDGDPDKKFSPEIIAALSEGKIRFVQGISGEVDVGGGRKKTEFVHAEMALLDRLVTADGFGEVAEEEVRDGRKPLYLGISKLCCLDCHRAVVALNRNNVALGRETGVVEVVEVRGEHLGEFPWLRPGFLKRRTGLEAEYLALRESPGPRTQAEQLADLSDSEAELEIISGQSFPFGVTNTRKRSRRERNMAERLTIRSTEAKGGGRMGPDATPGMPSKKRQRKR